jgi:hypothetical protein
VAGGVIAPDECVMLSEESDTRSGVRRIRSVSVEFVSKDVLVLDGSGESDAAAGDGAFCWLLAREDRRARRYGETAPRVAIGILEDGVSGRNISDLAGEVSADESDVRIKRLFISSIASSEGFPPEERLVLPCEGLLLSGSGDLNLLCDRGTGLVSSVRASLNARDRLVPVVLATTVLLSRFRRIPNRSSSSSIAGAVSRLLDPKTPPRCAFLSPRVVSGECDTW